MRSHGVDGMCGRYTQGKAIPELVSRYVKLGARLIGEEQVLHPSFNIAPGAYAPVLIRDGEGATLRAMRWGLVPPWAKSLDTLKSKPFNARSETADSGPMFRDAFRTRRCLVPAQGFYEWQGSKAPKQPWYIHATDQENVSFAGLWSSWKDPSTGTVLDTYTILTTDANETVQPLHDRMPCILHPDEEQVWLEPTTSIAACKMLLRPYPAKSTVAYPVSRDIGRIGNDGPSLMEPLKSKPPSEEGWLF